MLRDIVAKLQTLTHFWNRIKHVIVSKMFEKKQIFKLHILKELLSDEKNCVSLVPSSRLLALPPFFLNDMKSGILYLLNSMLKKYDRSLGGIVIGYQNTKILMDENTGIIPIGTSETNVNISVEFYIFQPKIGGLLEGVINKKSNNHIGCLVHRYFNATILKPEDVDFDDWTCKGFNVGDKVTFKVKDLDFTSLLPYIEGVVDDENLLNKVSVKRERNSDGVDDINKNVNTVSLMEEFLNRLKMSEQSNKEVLKNTKKKHRKKEEVKVSKVIMDSTEIKSGSLETKKHKKRRENSVVSSENEIQGGSSKKTDAVSGWGNVELNSEKGFDEKKKKKKKKKEKEGDSQESFFNLEVHAEKDENEAELSCEKHYFSPEKHIELENKNSNDFLTPVKLKKQKKRKKEEQESLRNGSECLTPKEDNVLYSTQLEPNSQLRMGISFCSPILGGVGTEMKEEEKSELSLMETDGRKTLGEEKEKRKKQKKRKREGDDELESASKKMKSWRKSISNTERLKSSKSECEKILEELYREEVSRVMGNFDVSDEERFKEKKIEKEKVVKKRREEARNELPVSKDGEVDGIGKKEIFEESSSLLTGAWKRGLKGKKESIVLDKEKNVIRKEETRRKGLKGKKNLEAQVNELDSDDRVERHSKQNEVEEKESEVKESLSGKKTRKEGKKSKARENRKEVSREKSNNSLYEKLLKEVRNTVDLVQDSTSSSTTSSKKTNSQKKSKHKEKTKDIQETSFRYKNGSMYDVSYSPASVKFDPDKSLFTDSDHSQTTPVKKRKELKGVEAVPEKKSKVQNMENQTSLKSKSNGEGSKDLIKNVKSRSPKREKEMLYQRLLQQAKRLIDFKGKSSPENNEKYSKDS